MNDVRIRIGTACILSLAAFLSIAGSVAVLVWWLLFTPRFKSLTRISLLTGSIAMVSAVAVLLQVLYGTGISYSIRMSAILLVAAWLWSEQRPGEFFQFGVWLFGRRWGFELGMTAELAMLAFDDLVRDLSWLKTAWKLKGMQMNTGNLAMAGIVLVTKTVERAVDTSELLAVRGYRMGGTLCPVFNRSPGDIIECIAALAVGLFAIIPVSGFFILP